MSELSIAQFNSEGVNAKNEGMAYITIDGKNHTLFYAKKVNFKISKNKTDVRVIGRRSIGHKATSWTGTGSLVVYAVTSLFKEMMLDYVNNGIDHYFPILVTNSDPSTQYGAETKVLTGCNLDEITIAELDSEDGILEQEIPFTFEGAELLRKYNEV